MGFLDMKLDLPISPIYFQNRVQVIENRLDVGRFEVRGWLNKR